MTINNSNIASYFRKFKRLAYSKNADEKELKEMMKNLIEYYKEKFGVSNENAYSMLFCRFMLSISVMDYLLSI